MVKAKIKFRDGSVQVGTGRVIDGVAIPWKDEDDLKKHVASIDDLEIVEVFYV